MSDYSYLYLYCWVFLSCDHTHEYYIYIIWTNVTFGNIWLYIYIYTSIAGSFYRMSTHINITFTSSYTMFYLETSDYMYVNLYCWVFHRVITHIDITYTSSYTMWYLEISDYIYLYWLYMYIPPLPGLHIVWSHT